MSVPQDDPALASVSCLSDPVRGQLYEVVARSPEPVGRDEAAAAVGIGRAIAVYHLDKLVESGLLTATYRRPPGRGGPGAGRPAKLYARSGREFTVTVPPREYELAAHLLARAVEADPDGASEAALRDAARRFGEDAGASLRVGAGAGGTVGGVEYAASTSGNAASTSEGAGRLGGGAASGGGGEGAGSGAGGGGGGGEGDRARLEAALRAHGFEPWAGADGTVVLRNCPFHQLAARHRDIVCGMNLALIEGLVTGLRADGMRPALDPRPGLCCVVIRSGERPAGTATTGAR